MKRVTSNLKKIWPYLGKSTKYRGNFWEMVLILHIKPNICVGYFGTINRCVVAETGEERVVKIVSKEKLGFKVTYDLRCEISNLTNLENENLCRVYEIFECSQNLYIISEYFEG